MHLNITTYKVLDYMIMISEDMIINIDTKPFFRENLDARITRYSSWRSSALMSDLLRFTMRSV